MIDIAEFVAESRAKQGLPPKVTDPAAIKRIARILLEAEGNQKPSVRTERLAS